MEKPRVFIVHLRRPRSAAENSNEKRSDPFWEFGSFGCTGCHGKNLLSATNAMKLDGARLAFAQGGHLGFRLVFLTPTVSLHNCGDGFEVRWSSPSMPFKYSSAPILVSNDGASDVPLLKEMVSNANRSTLEGAFSSCFRSRTLPLRGQIADQLVEAYEKARLATTAEIAVCYSEALPYPPPLIDRQRMKTYQSFQLSTVSTRPSCGNPPSVQTVAGLKRGNGC